MNIKLKQCSPPNDLQSGQNHFSYVDMTDEDVTGDLADILQKAEIETWVLKPRDLQIAVDVSTVGVPVSKIPIVVLLVGRYGKSAICANTNCNETKNKDNYKRG